MNNFLANCTSFEELKLRSIIFGKNNQRWDWLSLFQLLFYQIVMNMLKNIDNEQLENCNAKILYDDILTNIDTNNEALKIFKNKTIIIKLVQMAKSSKITILSNIILKLLAHILKREPDMWNISWLKSKQLINHKFKRCHSLKWALSNSEFSYDDFIKKYF